MARRKLLPAGAILTLIVLASLARPFAGFTIFAQPNSTCYSFVETGKTVCGKFLAYWQTHGGLPIFGYPISNPFREVSTLNGEEYTVQYFERALFELHPENQPPYDVELAQLGTYRFTTSHNSKEPGEPFVENLPLYPTAQKVNVVDIPVAVPDEDVIKIVTYETKDKQEAVRSFYQEIMPKNGWQVFAPPRSGTLDFVYVTSGGPVYGLIIDITATGTNTIVKLSLDKTLPK